MAKNIYFANGASYPYVEAVEEPEFYDNALRRVLTVTMERDAASMDELDALLSDEQNLTTLQLKNEGDGEPSQTVFSAYQLKITLAAGPQSVGTDAQTGEEVREDRIVFRLGRYTPVELRLRALGAM